MILSIGSGTNFDGGDIYMKSGDTTASTKDSGAISMIGGYATSTTKAVGGEIVYNGGRGKVIQVVDHFSLVSGDWYWYIKWSCDNENSE